MLWLRGVWEYVVGFFCGAAPRKSFEYNAAKLRGCGATVYGWMNADPWAVCRAIVKAGMNCTLIEALGWAGTSQYADCSQARKAYRVWVAACRHYRVTLIVVFVNKNAQQTKYGHVGISLSAHAANIRSMWDVILDCGPKGIIIEPVAECSGSKIEQDIERYVMMDCNARGYVTAAENGGQTAGGRANIVIRHPSGPGDVGRAGWLYVTDSGGILAHLSRGGDWQNQDADTVLLRAYCQTVLSHGAGFVHYVFRPGSPDWNAIKACGN